MVTAPQEPPMPGSRWRAPVTLAVATVGLALNLRAWILLGPHLHGRFGVSLRDYALPITLPVLVAAVVRLPVGALTDRYGARAMFPAVSVAAAAAVCGLGLANSVPAAVVAGGAAGIAGGAFVVGGALVSRAFPYGRRGLALGVFSLGVVGAVVISGVSRTVDPEGRRAAFALAGLLVGFAGLAGLVLRDEGAAGTPVRRSVEMVRLASRSSLSLLYALALGGVVATAVFLPAYLTAAVGLDRSRVAAVAGATVVLAAASRLVGGWWTDRRPTAGLLTVCYAVVAGLCLVLAVDQRRWLAAPVIAAIAVCDGVASGALLALIGKAARAESVGAVMGVTGAVAALGALLPPLVLIGSHRLTGSYAAAWILLAAVMLAVAGYVRANGLRVGLGLAVRSDAEAGPTAMTVALVGESDTRLGAAAVVSRLAELAANDELVVVYGSDASARPGSGAGAGVLMTGLRDRLPRHTVMAVQVDPEPGAVGHLAAPLGEVVEAGTVAIAVTPAADQRGVAAELSSYLRADRVLKVSYTLADGADLHEVWRRKP